MDYFCPLSHVLSHNSPFQFCSQKFKPLLPKLISLSKIIFSKFKLFKMDEDILKLGLYI